MKSIFALPVLFATALAFNSTAASAAGACVTKAAVATAGSEEQAKWFALETTVQALNWGLWPGFVANSKVEGYAVADRYKCAKDSGSFTCHAVTTFCKK